VQGRLKSISEIAFEWGFNDSAHFSRIFCNEFGLTPRAFRKMGMDGKVNDWFCTFTD
jgi:AraC family transcriptional regulator, positive regulator of tynA and feaB